MVPIIGVKHSINLVLMPSPTTITNRLNLIEKIIIFYALQSIFTLQTLRHFSRGVYEIQA